MMRILTVCAGLVGGAGLSQYPEFTQQYTQRLAGQVDALTIVVADFDRSALDARLTRTEALDQLTGSSFLDNRQADMKRTFARHANLSENLNMLRIASPFQRMTMPQRLMDAETLNNTWADFRPALPLSIAGVAAGGAGFFIAALLFSAVLSLLLLPLRRRPERRQPILAASSPVRADPPMRRLTIVPDMSQRPKLMGERRP